MRHHDQHISDFFLSNQITMGYCSPEKEGLYSIEAPDNSLSYTTIQTPRSGMTDLRRFFAINVAHRLLDANAGKKVDFTDLAEERLWFKRELFERHLEIRKQNGSIRYQDIFEKMSSEFAKQDVVDMSYIIKAIHTACPLKLINKLLSKHSFIEVSQSLLIPGDVIYYRHIFP